MSDESSATVSRGSKSKKKAAQGKRVARKTASAKSSAKSSATVSDMKSDKPGEPRPVKLRILDKEVQLACRPGEEDDLMQAAAYIDRSMNDLRRRNATSSIEKIAIVTAINTANALLKSRGKQVADPGTSDRIAKLNSQLDDLLENVGTSTNDSNKDTAK